MLSAGLATGCTMTITERVLFSFQPVSAPLPPARAEPIALKRDNGQTISGWRVQPRSMMRRATLLVFPGLSETAQFKLHWLVHRATELDVELVCVDYPADAESRMTSEDLERHALESYDLLVRDRRHPIVVYGLSLGSLLAVHLAEHRDIPGLILEGAISSLPVLFDHVIREFVPWHIRLCRPMTLEKSLIQRTQPIEQIPAVTAPLLILHGDADRLTPLAFSEQLLVAAGSKQKRLVEIPGRGHLDGWRDSDVAANAVRAFLAEIVMSEDAAMRPAPPPAPAPQSAILMTPVD